MKNVLLKISYIVLSSVTLFGASLSNEVIATKHNKNLTLGELAEIQPGLGAIMIEFGHRFYIAYYAAKANNWKLAKYELEELLEAQEIAEATRPNYAKDLKEFENSAFLKLQKAVEKKDWKLFESEYERTTKACNACHKSNDHGYIQYKLPKTPPKFLRMEVK